MICTNQVLVHIWDGNSELNCLIFVSCYLCYILTVDIFGWLLFAGKFGMTCGKFGNRIT